MPRQKRDRQPIAHSLAEVLEAACLGRLALRSPWVSCQTPLCCLHPPSLAIQPQPGSTSLIPLHPLCVVALGEQQTTRSSSCIHWYTPKWTARRRGERRHGQVLGSSQARLPGSRGTQLEAVRWGSPPVTTTTAVFWGYRKVQGSLPVFSEQQLI